jgi:hypothetical protein
LSLTKTSMVGKRKTDEELTRVLKILMPFSSFNNVNRNTALQRKGMEIVTFFWIATGQFWLLFY